MDKDKLKVLRFEKIIEEFGLEYDSIEVSELYLKKLGEGVFPFEATEKLCEYLHSKYEVGVNKPDKRIFECAIEYFEISDKKSTIMIGDSLEADIKGAQNAGIDTCWVNFKNIVNNTGSVPKYEVKKLEELFEIL